MPKGFYALVFAVRFPIIHHSSKIQTADRAGKKNGKEHNSKGAGKGITGPADLHRGKIDGADIEHGVRTAHDDRGTECGKAVWAKIGQQR